jgi:hypothetical protein
MPVLPFRVTFVQYFVSAAARPSASLSLAHSASLPLLSYSELSANGFFSPKFFP